MNPVSALFLFGLPLGVFSLADRLGHKASVVNASPTGDSGKPQPAVTSTGEYPRGRAMRLCAR